MSLEEKKQEIENAIKQTEANLLRLQGALILIMELLEPKEETEG